MTNIEEMKQFYQGDVGLLKLDKEVKLEFKLLPKEGKILAYGEVTGHTHTLVADREAIVELAKDVNGVYIKVLKGTARVKHQEHKEIVLNPGLWKVAVQFEYDEIEELKRVQD